MSFVIKGSKVIDKDEHSGATSLLQKIDRIVLVHRGTGVIRKLSNERWNQCLEQRGRVLSCSSNVFFFFFFLLVFLFLFLLILLLGIVEYRIQLYQGKIYLQIIFLRIVCHFRERPVLVILKLHQDLIKIKQAMLHFRDSLCTLCFYQLCFETDFNSLRENVSHLTERNIQWQLFPDVSQNLLFGKKSGQGVCFVRWNINLSFAPGTIHKVILKTNENENDSK